MPRDTTEELNESPSHRPSDVDLLRSALDRATVHAIIARAADGRVLSWNEGARRLYGFEAGQAIGEHGSMLWGGDSETTELFVLRSERVRATGRWEGTLERRRRDGTQVRVSVTLTARADENGQLLSLTEVSRAPNEPVEQKDARKMRALVATMSHDMRTPLNGIIGLAELMRGGKLGPVPAIHQEYLGDILTCARDLLAIVSRFVESTRDANDPPLGTVTSREPPETSS